MTKDDPLAAVRNRHPLSSGIDRVSASADWAINRKSRIFQYAGNRFADPPHLFETVTAVT